MKSFLEEMKIKAQIKAREMAREMARLELSIWGCEHEKSLIKDFNFNPSKVAKRKKQLQNEARKIHQNNY